MTQSMSNPIVGATCIDVRYVATWHMRRVSLMFHGSRLRGTLQTLASRWPNQCPLDCENIYYEGS